MGTSSRIRARFTAPFAAALVAAVALCGTPPAFAQTDKPADAQAQPAPAAPAPAAPAATPAAPASPSGPGAVAGPETSKDPQMQSPADAGKDGAPTEVAIAPPESVTLAAKPVLYATGKSSWDDAEQSLGNALNALYAAIAKGNLKAAGPPMIEYLDSGDEDFQFKAMVPVEKSPKTAPSKDVKIGQSPAGPALKFVHRGSFEDLEEVYNRIDDYLVSKSLDMKKVYEEYETDPGTTPPEKMVTNIYVVTD